jgi:hypothetical protein
MVGRITAATEKRTRRVDLFLASFANIRWSGQTIDVHLKQGNYSESIQLHNPVRLCWQGAGTGRRREESGGGGENSFTVAI